MAEIGDVLIKFVANFAEYTKNMEDGQQQLVKFGAQAAETGTKLEGFIGLAKNLLGGLAIGAIVQQVTAYADKVQASAVATADLARSVNLTTSEVQGLQALAQKTGDSFSDLAKKGAANRDWLAQVTADAERAGLVMDSSVVQTLKRIQVESDEGTRRLQVFFAPMVAGAKSWIADQLERIAEDLKTIGMQQGILDKLFALAQMLGYGAAGGGQFRIDALELQVKRREAELATAQQGPSPREIGAGQPGPDIGAAQKALDDARALLGQAKDAAAKAAYGSTTLDAKAVTVVADRITGGTKAAADDDTIQRQIDRYTALAKNAQAAYSQIFTGQNRYVDDLKREVAVQQQVDDIVARIVAKGHGIPSDEDKARLYDIVKLEQERRAESQKLLEAMTQAEALERRLGDGTKARELAQRDLDRQRATGILSPEAASRRQKEITEQTDAAANAAKRYDDNIGSLAAGFENAGNAFSRAHDLFSTGGQLFEGLMGAMSDSIDVLVGASNKGFDQIARDFALMLSKMAAQAALSEVFNLIKKGITTAISAYAGDVSPGSVSAADWQDMLNQSAGGGTWMPGRASGGPVSAGQPYIVGERGPEFFVPSAAGNIVPMGQTGGGVTVNVSMGQTIGASNPSAALDFGRKVKAAVQLVINDEKRPGGSLHPATA